MNQGIMHRQYLGESPGTEIAEWLNRKPASSRHQRIALAITRMIRFSLEPKSWVVPSGYVAFQRELGSTSFWKLLRLKIVPGTRPREKRDANEPDFERPRLYIGARDAATSTFLAALNLSQLEVLDRVRRCGECRRWFFARFAHQQYCPGGHCQKVHWTKTPQGLDYHRKKMREYRQLEAKRNGLNVDAITRDRETGENR
jgi:hypothetical protein